MKGSEQEMAYELTVEDTFDAAHFLRGYDGACANVHGHTWRVQASFDYALTGELGMAEDFGTLRAALEQVLSDFDHSTLNDLPPFQQLNPTAEHLARVIWERLEQCSLPIHAVTVWESPKSAVTYRTELEEATGE
jgi:6-pyruvoyltetrahydropterin/6-carboxytetrahydropterin synthase